MAKGSGGQWVFKAVFESPYSAWPRVPAAESEDIVKRAVLLLSQLSDRAGAREPHGAKRRRVCESSALLVGLNEVTRALDRACLDARTSGPTSKSGLVVIACPEDTSHGQVLQHIPLQCRIARVPLLALPRGAASAVGDAVVGRPVHVLAVRVSDATRAIFELVRRYAGEDWEAATLCEYRALNVQQIAVPRVRKAM